MVGVVYARTYQQWQREKRVSQLTVEVVVVVVVEVEGIALSLPLSEGLEGLVGGSLEDEASAVSALIRSACLRSFSFIPPDPRLR